MSTVNVTLRPAWRNYWVGFLVAGFLLLMAIGAAARSAATEDNLGTVWWFVAAVLVLAFILYKRFSWKFTIDDNRVSRHYGLISRNQQSVRIKDLRSVELDQSFFQRIFGIGNLAFYSAGSATAEVKFIGIRKPSEWRDKIDDLVDQLKDSTK